MYNMTNLLNKIVCGDNLQVTREIPDESIDLIYLDPPFFSNSIYEKIWGDKDEVRSFEDRWKGGINVYIEWMSDRIKELHRILKSTGTIYLHCDHHASHHLKVELDKIFGDKNFMTEIIWQRSLTPLGSLRKKLFPIMHDTIFVYSKEERNTIYNTQYITYPESYYKRFKHDDKDGKGKYEWQYYQKGTEPTEKTINENNNSKIEFIRLSETGVWQYKRYLNDESKGDSSRGRPMISVWTDINNLNPCSNERCGYPTQKPEALLERIIKASSNPGDIILDPFVGGGTTAVVAKNLRRKFIGIEISTIGTKIAAKRIGLREDDIIGLPSTIEDLRNMSPWEFQQWVCDKMQARNLKPRGGSDGGIDGIISLNSSSLFSFEEKEIRNKYSGCPIQVKQQDSVGINVVKNLFATMHEMKKNFGFIVGFSFASTAHEQVAKYKNEGSVVIKLITAEDLCKSDKYSYEE